MARPRKADVDYFPHDTKHTKTMFILESKWGNDGYAVWFKLLECLGCSDGHYLDCREQASMIYLAAKMRVSELILIDIFNALADIDAIDRDLWRHKLVYCQHFIDRITDAYRRRKERLPSKEKVIAVTNIVIDDINLTEQTLMQQREREREREREIKEITPPTPSMTLLEIRTRYREMIGTELGGGVNQTLLNFCKDYTPDFIIKALLATSTRSPRPVNPFMYFKSYLEGNQDSKDISYDVDEVFGKEPSWNSYSSQKA